MTVPSGMSLMANAPSPPLGDGRTSKKSFLNGCEGGYGEMEENELEGKGVIEDSREEDVKNEEGEDFVDSEEEGVETEASHTARWEERGFRFLAAWALWLTAGRLD